MTGRAFLGNGSCRNSLRHFVKTMRIEEGRSSQCPQHSSRSKVVLDAESAASSHPRAPSQSSHIRRSRPSNCDPSTNAASPFSQRRIRITHEPWRQRRTCGGQTWVRPRAALPPCCCRDGAPTNASQPSPSPSRLPRATMSSSRRLSRRPCPWLRC